MKPDFSELFPKVDPELKIKDDSGNVAHGPHFDAIQSICGGTEQIRISPDGDIIDGVTNIGKVKLPWP